MKLQRLIAILTVLLQRERISATTLASMFEVSIRTIYRDIVLDYCRDEYIEELSDGYLHIKMPFVESEMGYSMLLGMGHQCEIIAPEYIRLEVIKRISQMKSVYE